MKTVKFFSGMVFAFFVVFLVSASFSGCSGSEAPPPTTSLTVSETTSISVFYPNGKILMEERQVVPVSDNLPEVALRRLFAASPQELKIVVVLPEAKVKSVRVDKKTGICTVDFSKEILDFSESEEKAKVVAFASIVETLKQFPEIKKLVITVEGRKKGVVNGKRIEDFWGNVTLKKQPVDIIRQKNKETTEEVSK